MIKYKARPKYTQGKVAYKINSIKYFEEECINKFEKFEDNFMKDPLKFAEYVEGLTKMLHNLGLRMIQESFKSMNEMIKKPQKVTALGGRIPRNKAADYITWNRYV